MTGSWPGDFIERLDGYEGLPAADPPPPRRAAVAAILKPDPSELLLMRRVEHEKDPWSGHVSLPGGGHEVHDDDLLETARREVHEEVGLDLRSCARLLGRLDVIQAVGHGRALPMDITPYVFLLEDPEARPTAGDEAEEVFWLPLPLVVTGRLDTETVWRRGGVRRRLPAWGYGGHTIWGLTYRMIEDLLQVVR